MSHMSVVGIVIHDISSLERACRVLGLTLRRDRKEATYYNHKKKRCFAVVEVPGTAFEVAVQKNPDGTYSLEADFYGQEGKILEKICGKNLGKILQIYAIERAKVRARQQGYSYHETKMADGSVKLVLKRKAKVTTNE